MLAIIVAITIVIISFLCVTKFKSSSAATTIKATNDAKSNAAQCSDAEQPNKMKLAIFYGSQSGTSETFAREFLEEAKLNGIDASVYNPEEYENDDLSKERFVVFLVATYGEGDPPDNIATMYEWLSSNDCSKDTMQNVTYAVFALGNRQYEHFCKVGRVIDEKMHTYGGERLIEVGEGDDDSSLEDDFNTWKKSFWEATRTRFGTNGPSDLINILGSKPFASSYKVIQCNEAQHKAYVGGITTLVTDPKHNVVKAKVLVNRELRQCTSEGSTRHIELDISCTKLKYVTADNLGVYPRNDFRLAAQIIKRLKYDPNMVFVLKTNTSQRKPYLPIPCSIRDAFLYYLDFVSSPRIITLPVLAQYTTDEKEKAQLFYWASEGKDEYIRQKYSFTEVLEKVPGVHPPLADFLDFCPKLAPRYYTISSSSLRQPTAISITVSLVAHQLPDNRTAPGICSTYLCSLRPGEDTVAVFIRPSSFRFPQPKPRIKLTASQEAAAIAAQPSHPPVIMVGPGTGIAPFRAFIQEAEHLKLKGIELGEMELYFGCRESSKDYIYNDELTQAQTSRTLHQLHLAFSREKLAADGAKVYVQDRMRINSGELWKALSERKGYIFTCGGTAMGRSVRELLVELAKVEGKMSNEEADKFVKKLQSDKRFVQELWS